MDRNLSLLGIAKKAGLLAVGGEAVCSAARKGKARLIMTACDASDGAVRRARWNSEEGGAVYITVPYTKFELGSITGRGSPGTVAFLDSGLAAGFVKGLAETQENYCDAVGLLEKKFDARAKRASRRDMQ
jgi:ribosomal protein L7Ae-like RNA K-turn-binding protein